MQTAFEMSVKTASLPLEIFQNSLPETQGSFADKEVFLVMLGLITNSTMCSPIMTGSNKNHNKITD